MAINFRSKNVELEGVVSVVEANSPGVVLCHPHPVFGGNMDSPVIAAIARTLNDRGLSTLRFNFRGIGESQGKFSNGSEEPSDVKAALDLLRAWPGIDGKRLGLVGYSFGAQTIIMGPAQYKAAKSLVLISPPLSSFDDSPIGKDKRPRLFLVGENDRLVGAEGLRDRVEAFPRPASFEVVPGVDHTWRAHEAELADKVAQFLTQTLR